MKPNLDDVLAALGLTDHREAIAEAWATSMTGMPERPPFLERDFLRGACAYLDLPGTVEAEVMAAALRIREDLALTALAWHGHCRLGEAGLGLRGWPSLAKALGAQAGMFYVLLVLSFAPRARAVHTAHQVPEDVVRATMGDVLLHIERYRCRHGAWGLDSAIAGGWLMHHFRGEIYRLGRLQFMARPFPKGFHVLRRARDGTVAVLLDDGLELRRDGALNGSGGVTESEGTWLSRYRETDEAFIGHPVDPAAATAARETVSLRRPDWGPVLNPGDTTLDMHIPEGGPLDFEACGESMARAVRFFRRHFPAARFQALSSVSWIFDPRLEGLLSPQSNLVRFLREFYLFPAQGDAWSIVRCVWDVDVPRGAERFDVSSLPADTSLRRGIIEYIERGGHFCKTGALMLPTELSRYGLQPYRRQKLSGLRG